MKKLLHVMCILMLSMSALMASDTDIDTRCASVHMDNMLKAKFPELGPQHEFEAWLADRIESMPQRSSKAITTIPVVFHVIHDNDAVGSGDNISQTYLNAQIDQLNNDFGKIAGTSGDNNNPVGVDTEVRWTLAAVNRINRSDEGFSAPPYTTNYIENTIKGATYWDPDQYCNIWVADISGGILGYAQFPSQSGLGGLDNDGGPASTDGVVILTSSVGSTTTPYPGGGSYNKGRTLTHELGHWLGLRHIWGDGGCSVDDYVTDTPTSDGANYGCPNTTSCGSTDMVENYMDYTDDTCMNIYTAGQKARIQAVLANSLRRQFGGGTGGNNAPNAAFSTSTNDLTVSFTDSSTDSDGSVVSRSWNFGDGSTSSATNPTHTYASAGTYTVTLTVTDNEGATDSASQSVTVSTTPTTGELTDEVPVTGLSGASSAWQHFYIDVPAGASALNVAMSGGSGDADLYVRFGAQPTTGSYDCRPYSAGNNENCDQTNPSAGRWYISIRGYSSYSGVSLVADIVTGGSSCDLNDTVSNLSASRTNWVRFTQDVPSCASNFTAAISGGSGDADLYVRYGSQPTTSSYDCRPYRNGNNETCSINNPNAGTWHIGIRAYSTFSGVTLNVSYE